MTLIVKPKTKEQEKLLKAFLKSHSIGFHTEAEEDKALYNAMQKGRKSRLLNSNEKSVFLHNLS